MSKYTQSCPEHPESEIIPGLDAFYCYTCKAWLPETKVKSIKWGTGQKKLNKKKKEQSRNLSIWQK